MTFCFKVIFREETKTVRTAIAPARCQGLPLSHQRHILHWNDFAVEEVVEVRRLIQVIVCTRHTRTPTYRRRARQHRMKHRRDLPNLIAQSRCRMCCSRLNMLPVLLHGVRKQIKKGEEKKRIEPNLKRTRTYHAQRGRCNVAARPPVQTAHASNVKEMKRIFLRNPAESRWLVEMKGGIYSLLRWHFQRQSKKEYSGVQHYTHPTHGHANTQIKTYMRVHTDTRKHMPRTSTHAGKHGYANTQMHARARTHALTHTHARTQTGAATHLYHAYCCTILGSSEQGPFSAKWI